ncbi:hypothetical protein J4E08_03870 [Sagittula sp. NFXS13]|uniref:hypothetical protein n=1 Tax=Sagittula sp. NFXS13 TaxID=2819095 RepID=UPI0032DE2F87
MTGIDMRIVGWTLLAMSLAGQAVARDEGPGPMCYRKVNVEAVYETSRRLVRKARLVHNEAETGQITMTHFPAIYIEEKALVSPAYVLLKQVTCTRRILRRAESLPDGQCDPLKGCTELEPLTLVDPK